jgi:hypothetical protein
LSQSFGVTGCFTTHDGSCIASNESAYTRCRVVSCFCCAAIIFSSKALLLSMSFWSAAMRCG